MKTRIIGFDLARAYAIFGMFIVNFNTVFGSHTNHTGLSGGESGIRTQCSAHNHNKILKSY